MSHEVSVVDEAPPVAVDRRPASALRAALAALLVTLPALFVVADTAIAYVGGWRFSSRFDSLGALSAGIWLGIVIVACIIPASRRWLSGRIPQLAALSISVMAMWLVAELMLGPLLNRLDNPYLWQPGVTRIYHPLPGVMRDVSPESHVRTNVWGIRGSDPPPRDKAYRILCLGGSSTACTYLDDTKTWPAILESHLQASSDGASGPSVWVGNAGMPSLRSAENLQFVEQSPLVDQIDCVVLQTGINDLTSCLAGPRPTPPRWIDSRVWRLTHLVVRSRIDSGTLVEDAAGDVYRRRRAVRNAAAISDEQPQIDACLAVFEKNLRDIIAACRRRDVRVVFTTQPVLWRADLDAENDSLLWFGQLAEGRYLSAGQLRAAMDRYNDVVRQVCQTEGVGLVDLDQLSGDPAVFYDDCHFTETGARRVAKLVADWLIANPNAKASGEQS